MLGMDGLDLKDDALVADDAHFLSHGQVLTRVTDGTPAIAIDGDTSAGVTGGDGLRDEDMPTDQSIHAGLCIMRGEPATHQWLKEPECYQATHTEANDLHQPAPFQERRRYSQQGPQTKASQDEAWGNDLQRKEQQCCDKPQLPHGEE